MTCQFGSRISRTYVALWLAATLAPVIGCGPAGPVVSLAPAAGTQPPSSELAYPLFVAPTISLGKINIGGTASRSAVVVNAANHVVRVDSIRSSCPCVRVEPATFELPPGQSQDLKITADMSDEVEFTGGLGVRVELLGPGKQKLGEFQVDLDVRDIIRP